MAGMDESAKTVLKDARAVARERGARNAEPLDVFVAALRTSPEVEALVGKPHQLSWEELAKEAAADTPRRGLGRLLPRPVGFDDRAKAASMRAVALAVDSDVSARHLAAAALEQDDARLNEYLVVRGTSWNRLVEILVS
ncbi:MAG: hypothetical protein E7Z94_10735 [Actinomyces ruminicola]|uniref:Clp amino terminal domain-containing protein, pathogenicity island component n=1 Tax=Actinomyces ruminicola TaxID=332524 RepID=A0A1G9TSV1_9ACTO|nr:hypothetical protein [Actinomyces ruminicola]MBE6482823.1 hypothetical protein [Actinomyces ruminicola]SDM50803.1 hypothetical protein SAMN04487766_103127 [Actinomyces ruminicola]